MGYLLWVSPSRIRSISLAAVLEVVTMKEIDAIFAVTDALGIHRESLVIPLGPAAPGRVRRLPSGKLEITVEAARPLDEWLTELPRLIAAAPGRWLTDRLRPAPRPL